MKTYEFIDKHLGQFPTTAACAAMGVSRSAYYAHKKGLSHRPSEREAGERSALRSSFMEHRSRYGSRRLAPELRGAGFTPGRHRTRRLMREEGLRAIQPRSFVPRTTDSRQTRKPSPNLLLERDVLATGPNQVLVGDITYIPLGGGKWAYLATWLDLFARKLAGWHLDTHMRAEIVLKALEKAEGRRCLGRGAIVHSDQGSQYASAKFRKHLANQGYQQSMSRKGDCYDNAFAESFFSRLKGELLEDGIFDTFDDAHTEIFNYIECYYNSKRRHSALGYLCPDKFEEVYFSNLTECP